MPLVGCGQEPSRTHSHSQADATSSGRLTPIRLSRSHSASLGSGDRSVSEKGPRNTSSFGSAAGSLIIVIGLIVGAGYLLKRNRSTVDRTLPDEFVTIIGNKPLDSRTVLQLVRCGPKLLVLANSAQFGVRPLSEFTDPQEIENILTQFPGLYHTTTTNDDTSQTTTSSRLNRERETVLPNSSLKSNSEFPARSTGRPVDTAVHSGGPRV